MNLEGWRMHNCIYMFPSLEDVNPACLASKPKWIRRAAGVSTSALYCFLTTLLQCKAFAPSRLWCLVPPSTSLTLCPQRQPVKCTHPLCRAMHSPLVNSVPQSSHCKKPLPLFPPQQHSSRNFLNGNLEFGILE